MPLISVLRRLTTAGNPLEFQDSLVYITNSSQSRLSGGGGAQMLEKWNMYSPLLGRQSSTVLWNLCGT